MISVDFLCYREASFFFSYGNKELGLASEMNRGGKREKNVNMVNGKYLRHDLPKVVFCDPNHFEQNEKGNFLEHLFTFLLFLFFKASCLQYFIAYPVPSFLLHL